MKTYKIFLIASLCFFIFLKNINTEDFSAKTILPKILSNEPLDAIAYWNYGNYNFLVEISSYSKKLETGQFIGRKLIIYQKINSEFSKIFEYDASLDHFLGMFPLTDNSDRFITIWISGSSYHFNILRIFESKINFVLESGSHNFPELVDIDDDGELEILISEGYFLINRNGEKTYPEKTDIYKWNGKLYLLVKAVPWKNRLEALKEKRK